MRTIVLGFVLAACCSAAIGADELVKQLDADYRKLLAKEEDPSPLWKAERLLERTNRNTRWTNYLAATRVLRKSRSKAGIPLVLKYAAIHAKTGAGNFKTYSDTLVILSGDDIELPTPTGADRPKSGRDNVAKLVAAWWTPKKATITTDLDQMKPDSLRRVVGLVATRTLGSSSYYPEKDAENPEKLFHLLCKMLRYSTSDRTYWYREELNAAMVPHLLAMSGYTTKTPAKAKASLKNVDYRAVPLLAALRKDGEAPDLHKIAEDPRQISAVRLTCILAVAMAGEEIQTEELLAIIEKEKRPAIRLPAILALEYSIDSKNVTPKLLDLMDDRNAAVCTAAAYAMDGAAQAVAVPRLKKIIDRVYPLKAMYPAMRALGKIKTADSAQALVDFMVAASKDAKKGEYLSRAMSAFRSSTGCPIRIPAGVPREGVVAARVKQALEWWQANKASK